MRRISTFGLAFWASVCSIAVACGGSESKPKPAPATCTVGSNQGCAAGMVCQAVTGGQPACFCNFDAQTGCSNGQVCEQITAASGTSGADAGAGVGNTGCFAPVSVQGQVFDIATTKGISGALVVARDVNDVPVSGLAKTDASGNYTLQVPTPRDTSGKPTTYQVTLRADAAGYLTFPEPPRIALPIDVSQASGNPLVLKNVATNIGLIAIPNANTLGTISGHVVAPNPWGTVVVAGGTKNAGGGVTGIADRDGAYTVFNVPAGTVTVKGYKQFLQLDTAQATVTGGQTTQNVDLHALSEAGSPTQTVSGSIDIVNPGNGNLTSVILAVDETFNTNPDIARGEAPPGLKASNVSNAWKIDGVPNGNYVVLAAFENDFLVRDPDTSIAGTVIVHVTVPGPGINPISQAFKVTGSLDHPSPDNEQIISAPPTFMWDDDAGEDHYELKVFDALGNKIWENLAVPGHSGAGQVQAAYGGPAFTSGMLYQFRAISIKLGGTPLATTEDLRGTFIFK